MAKNIISIAHHLEPVDLEELRMHGHLLKNVSFFQRSYEVCKIAAESDGICLRDIPKELLNDELVHLCVNSYGAALLEAPEEYWTDTTLCLKAFCCEDTYSCFYHSQDHLLGKNEKRYAYLILENAISVCPQLKSIMELRIDPVIAANLIKIFAQSKVSNINVACPVFE